MAKTSRPWKCVYCGKPIVGGNGFVDIHNNNPELGEVGGYPVQATPDSWSGSSAPKAGLNHEQAWSELLKELQQVHNVAASVFHRDCHPNLDLAGYRFPVGEAETLSQWCTWIVHLREKTWLGRDDLIRLLGYYFMNRGLNPYATGVGII